MTPKQIDLVHRSWLSLQPMADTAAELFYKRVFELDPSLRSLFKRDLKEQGRQLMQMIGIAVSNLSHLDSIVPAVQALGRRHAGYGVVDEHYATVADALLWTLEQGLGERFTREVRDAWTAAYKLLAQTMQAGARDSVRAMERAN